MLLYRQEFELEADPQNIILLPNLFTQPQLVIFVAGSLSFGRDSSYAGKLQQQLFSPEINYKIRGEVIGLDFGYQLFAPKFYNSYQLEFVTSNRLQQLSLSVYELDQLF